MLTIIRGADVYSPSPLGQQDILLLGGTIGAVTPSGKIQFYGIGCREIDARGKIAAPGFIDSHVHILGGGGEGGPATRAPEIRLEDIIASGVTTVIGCLGTDGVTRNMNSLLAKARGLEREGVTTYVFTGSYEIPVKTLTGSVRSDLILIDKVIGAGEIAISDHRSSQPSFDEFARLAAECRVGGMLGGKAGKLHCHLGEGLRRLELIERLITDTEIPASQIIPTHCNRNAPLLEEAIAFVHKGGTIDLTAGADPEPVEEGHLSISQSLQLCRERRAPFDHITISSDSNGSMPVFDAAGRLTGLTIATQASLLANFRHLVQSGLTDLPEALGFFTANPAGYYGLDSKGEIAAGRDADLLILDGELRLLDVFARGRRMMADGTVTAKGTFS